MASGFLGLVSGVLLAGCSAFGVRSAEEPAYRTVTRVGAVEIRDYGPRLAAEALVGGDEIAARAAGFRRLAGYIFGGNKSRADIAMTAPVTQGDAGGNIAMTAPVDQSKDPGGAWRIRFYMPARYTLASLPEPLDPGVRIVTVPAETVAVLRYSGVPSSGAVRDANAKLLGVLAGSGWTANSAPAGWFYDPPWTVPPLRRNEAAVPVSRAATSH